MATTSAQVQQLYVGLLGRAADQTGLNYWLNELNATPAKLTLENLRANIVNSQPEYKAIFGSLSRTDTVTKIYNNLFGRAPDAAGLAYWTTGAGASVNVDQLTLAFINGASASDTQALTNKTLVSEVYTSTAGTAFVAADAAAIISGVTSTPTTVSAALTKLTDGSLAGVAVPATVALIKAVETSTAAVSAFQSSKVTELTTINTNLVAAAKAISATDTTVTTVTTLPADSATVKFGKLTDATTGIAKEITDARTLIGDGQGGATVTTTAQLQVTSDAKAKTLADASAALKLAGNGYITVIDKYEAAVKALAAVKDVTAAAVGQAKATLVAQVAFATTEQKAALVTALNATGVTALNGLSFADSTASATSVDAIYDALKATGTTAQVSTQIDTALTSYNSYSAVKSAAAQAKDFAAKTDAVTAADTALKAAGSADAAEATYIAAVSPATVAAKALADSKAIDAIEAQYKAIIDGNTAVVGTQTQATTNLATATNLLDVKLTATTATYDADVLGGINDVFFFGTDGTAVGVTGAKDAIITNAGSLGTVKGVDSIYVGTDYVKGTGTATATNGITGGNDGAKEVFFFQKGNDTFVVIEAKSFGSSTVTDFTNVAVANTASPDAAVIQLTGVGIEKVSFANGVVSIA